MKYDKLPWIDSKKWNPDFWYPLAVSSMWTDPEKCTVVEGYDVFKLDPEGFEGDITAVFEEVKGLSFSWAVDICEAHNQESFDLK